MDIESKLKGAAPKAGKPSEQPSALLQILIASEPHSEVLPFPRKGANGEPLFDYRMRVLKQSEIDVCAASAEQHARRVFRGDKEAVGDDIARVRAEAWDEVYRSAKVVELLFHACRDAENPKRPLFDTPGQIRELLTVDECAALVMAYDMVQAKFGPLWSALTDEELEKWIELLVKGADLRPLSRLAPSALAQLAISMAFRLRVLKTDTGSFGSPSLDGESDDSQISDNA